MNKWKEDANCLFSYPIVKKKKKNNSLQVRPLCAVLYYIYFDAELGFP